MTRNRWMAYVGLSWKNLFTYRFAFLMNVLRAPLSLAIVYFLYKAIYSYQGTGAISGYTFPELVSYLVVSTIIGSAIYVGIDRNLAGRIKNGSLVVLLSRPLSFLRHSFYSHTSEKVFVLFAEYIPILIIGIFIFNLRIVTMPHAFLAVLSVLLAIILNYLFVMLIAMGAFWLKEFWGVRRLREGVVWLMSGGLLPLTFFPIWFQNLSQYLPFQYFRFVPIQIFLAKYEIFEAIKLIGVQLIWIAILYAALHYAWKAAYKQFAGAGT